MNRYFNDPHGVLNFSYPDGWEVQVDDEIVSVYNPIGVGALQLSTYRLSTTSEIDIKVELQQFLGKQEVNIKDSMAGNYAYASFLDEQDRYWRYWLFLRDGVVVLVTYNCEKEDVGIEDYAIIDILSSLFN